MRRTTPALLCVLALLACDEKKEGPAGSASASASAAPSAVPTPPPAASTAAAAPSASASAAGTGKLAERLKCDALLPEKALTGPLANMKVGQPPATCADCGPTCSVLVPGKPFEGATVSYICNEKLAKDAVTKKLADIQKTLKKAKPVSDFGRGGVGGEREDGLFYHVAVQDDDSDCFVTVDWMRGKRDPALAAAKAAIAGIKQADLGTK